MQSLCLSSNFYQGLDWTNSLSGKKHKPLVKPGYNTFFATEITLVTPAETAISTDACLPTPKSGNFNISNGLTGRLDQTAKYVVIDQV
jgi:hypothetical protein